MWSGMDSVQMWTIMHGEYSFYQQDKNLTSWIQILPAGFKSYKARSNSLLWLLSNQDMNTASYMWSGQDQLVQKLPNSIWIFHWPRFWGLHWVLKASRKIRVNFKWRQPYNFVWFKLKIDSTFRRKLNFRDFCWRSITDWRHACQYLSPINL